MPLQSCCVLTWLVLWFSQVVTINRNEVQRCCTDTRKRLLRHCLKIRIDTIEPNVIKSVTVKPLFKRVFNTAAQSCLIISTSNQKTIACLCPFRPSLLICSLSLSWFVYSLRLDSFVFFVLICLHFLSWFVYSLCLDLFAFFVLIFLLSLSWFVCSLCLDLLVFFVLICLHYLSWFVYSLCLDLFAFFVLIFLLSLSWFVCSLCLDLLVPLILNCLLSYSWFICSFCLDLFTLFVLICLLSLLYVPLPCVWFKH